MRHFMQPLTQLFLNTHRQAVTEGWEVHISVVLDRKALQLYDQALVRATARWKSKQKNNPQTVSGTADLQRLIREELVVELTRLLSRANLCDPIAYEALKQAVQNWCPWEIGAQQPGVLIRETLLSLLPQSRKKQALDGLCNNYRDHLATVIEGHLSSDYPAIHAQLSAEQSRVFGAPPFENGEPRALSIDSRCQVLDRFVAEQAQSLQKPSVALTGAIDKYRAVAGLQESLKTPIKSVTAQLQDFSQQFKTVKPVIEQDRDSWAVKFVKGVATLLSLGAAALFGIWHIQGKNTAEKIEQALSTSTPDLSATTQGRK